MISIVIPIHNMPNKDFFLKRCLDSIDKQSFKDYEILQIEEGSFAQNCNAGIGKTKGNLIKFLCMDDYLFHQDSLQEIADNFKNGWLVTACAHDAGDGLGLFNPHLPSWNSRMAEGVNTIGSPSSLTIENKEPLFFNEQLVWLVDCEYYKRLYDRYGMPTIVNNINVINGIHEGQMTHKISDDIKLKEQIKMKEQYG